MRSKVVFIAILFLIFFSGNSLGYFPSDKADHELTGMHVQSEERIWLTEESINPHFYQYNSDWERQFERELGSTPIPPSGPFSYSAFTYEEEHWWVLTGNNVVYKFNDDWVFQKQINLMEKVPKIEDERLKSLEKIGEKWYVISFAGELLEYDEDWNFIERQYITGTYVEESIQGGTYETTDNAYEITHSPSSGVLVRSDKGIYTYDDYWQKESLLLDEENASGVSGIAYDQGKYYSIQGDELRRYDRNWNRSTRLYNLENLSGSAEDVKIKDGKIWILTNYGDRIYKDIDGGWSDSGSLEDDWKELESFSTLNSEDYEDIWAEDDGQWLLTDRNEVFKIEDDKLLEWPRVLEKLPQVRSFYQDKNGDWYVIARGVGDDSRVYSFTENWALVGNDSLTMDRAEGLTRGKEMWYVVGEENGQPHVGVYDNEWNEQKLFRISESADVRDISYIGDGKWYVLVTGLKEDSVNTYTDRYTLLGEWRKVSESGNIGQEDRTDNSGLILLILLLIAFFSRPETIIGLVIFVGILAFLLFKHRRENDKKREN